MIIGNGMIAKAFVSYKNNDIVCIFASGVSNSREVNELEFKRELDLLKKIIKENKNKTLVYFSTCSIYDKSLFNTPYVKHKKKMEEYIIFSGVEYHIFRITQVVGFTKNNTLISGLSKMIKEGTLINIFGKSTRNLIDIDDVYKIIDYYICNRIYCNEIINIASPYCISPLEIVSILEGIYQKKSLYNIIDIGDSYTVDISNISNYLEVIGITFQKTYSRDVICKYFKAD